MEFGHRKPVRAAVMAICSIALIVVARLWYLKEQGNFHPITPGEAYRSAQMDRDELEDYIRKFKIRSIINLRGEEPDERYEEEISTCRKLGVSHFALGLSADKAPSSREIKKLLRLFRVAPRAVLIHCLAGSDRAGLASALWKVAADGASASVVKRQRSIRYGHIPFGPTPVLDEFFDKRVSTRGADMNTEKMTGKLFNRREYAAD